MAARTPGRLRRGNRTESWTIAMRVSMAGAARGDRVGPGGGARSDSDTGEAHTARWRAIATAMLWGAAVGEVVWNRDELPEPGRLALLALIPVRWGRSERATEAFVLVLSYQLAALRRIPAWVAPSPRGGGDDIVEWAGCLTIACLAALPWAALAPEPSTGCRATFARGIAILVVSSIPPFGWISPFAPFMFTAALFPGLCGWGIASGYLTGGACAAVGRRFPARAACAVAMAAMMTRAVPIPAVLPPAGWRAVDTRLGALEPTFDAYAERQRRLVAAARSELAGGARLVVLPESIAGAWSPAIDVWWRDVAGEARDAGALLLVGTDWPTRTGYVNALKALGRREGIAAVAGVVVPQWRRGGGRAGGAHPGGTDANDRIEVDGSVIAVLFCVEELLPWPALNALLAPRRAGVLVAVANHGWLAGAETIPHQPMTSRAWARLFGVALLRAENFGQPHAR